VIRFFEKFGRLGRRNQPKVGIRYRRGKRLIQTREELDKNKFLHDLFVYKCILNEPCKTQKAQNATQF
jgi:hypothetical protein